MLTTDPWSYAEDPHYYKPGQFVHLSTGVVLSTWTHGIPTILPPCTHVALVTVPVEHGVLVVRGRLVVPRADIARLAERWWHHLDRGAVRIERCPEDEWYRLLNRAAEHEVEMPPRADSWRNN